MKSKLHVVAAIAGILLLLLGVATLIPYAQKSVDAKLKRDIEAKRAADLASPLR